MRRLFTVDPSNFFFQFLSIPDDGSGGGGNTPPEGSEKTFTQKEVEQLIQGRVANTAKKLAEKEKDVEALKVANDELKKQLDDLNAKLKGPEGDLEGRLKILESKHQKEVEALKNELKATQDAAEKERSSRLQLQKNSEITSALQKAGCRSDAIQIGLRFFQDKVVQDDDGDWKFELSKGGTVSVELGIADELPDYMRDPAIRNSGSGALPGKGQQKARLLEQEREALKALEAKAKKTADVNVIAAYKKQKRKVEALEAGSTT